MTKNPDKYFDKPISNHIDGFTLIEFITNCAEEWNVSIEDIQLEVISYDYDSDISLSASRKMTEREFEEHLKGLENQRLKNLEYKRKQLEALKKELGE